MMDENRRSVLGLIIFLLALCALLTYRPILRVAGVDLDHTVPEWADFFTPGQYGAFLKEVRGYFQVERLAVRIDDDRIYPENGEEYGLKYLAQKCHQVKRAEWAALVRVHFDRLLGLPVRPVSGQEKGRRVRPPVQKTP